MSKFVIQGNATLSGNIRIGGAKNSGLKLIPAAILSDETSTLFNIPDILDIHRLCEILESVGADISFKDGVVKVNPKNINSCSPDSKLVRKLRGSIVVMGPLLAKYGEAVFSKPGGCLIGSRPIDDHLDLFSQLGVKIIEKDDCYHLSGKPKAADIILNKMSVTATENAIMATVLSPGTTTISVAAAEPEIVDLANFLNKMGADISGAGTHNITVNGVDKLHGASHTIIPDRIEAATYLIAAIATNSVVKIGPVIPEHLSIVIKKLLSAGAKFHTMKEENDVYFVTEKHGELAAQSIDTRTYPGFSTDIQSPYVALMTQAKGKSQIFETLYEGRFLFLEELKMMGAETNVLSPHIIEINGPTPLKGGEIYSRDIRGGAALIVAALIASGTTIINGVEYVDRGYENMDTKLKEAGVEIERIEE